VSDEERLPRMDYRTDEDLARELAALGPLMARQERLTEEAPDPTFVAALRARLVGRPAEEPDPVFTRPAAGGESRCGPAWPRLPCWW
jgi:hypothetical protein